eukprot:6723383-Alexandrium_andersonii.AAC.1
MCLNRLCVHMCMCAGRARGVRVHFLRQGERHAAKCRGLGLPVQGERHAAPKRAPPGGNRFDTGTQGQESLEHCVRVQMHFL